MSYRKLLTLAAVVGLATSVMAQTNEDLSKRMDAMQKQMDILKAENQALKEVQAAPQDAALETEINRVTERMAAGCTLNSKATQVTLDGEIRSRTGIAFGRPGAAGDSNHDGTWNTMRSRLGFQYEFTRDVTARVALQSNWAAGDNLSTDAAATGANAVFVYESWVEMRNCFNRPELSSKWGRQEVVLGNQFQFGNADWYNGISFDGCRHDWRSESFDLTLMMLRLTSSPSEGDVNQFPLGVANNHHNDDMWTAYFTLKTIKNHKLDLYWIYTNGDNTLGTGINSGAGGAGALTGAATAAYFHTFGGRIGGTLDVACGLDWNAEVAYQIGAQSDYAAGILAPGSGLAIDDLTAELEVGLTFNKDNKFRVYGRFLYAEGPELNAAGTAFTETGYLTLFPNRHSNGSMHARYGLADGIPMTNVITAQLGAHFDPAANWTLGLTGLWANADQQVFGVPGQNKRYAWEIDLWAEYRYSENLTWGAGAAIAFLGDEGRAAAAAAFGAPVGATQFLGYVQARLSF